MRKSQLRRSCPLRSLAACYQDDDERMEKRALERCCLRMRLPEPDASRYRGRCCRKNWLNPQVPQPSFLSCRVAGAWPFFNARLCAAPVGTGGREARGQAGSHCRGADNSLTARFLECPGDRWILESSNPRDGGRKSGAPSVWEKFPSAALQNTPDGLVSRDAMRMRSGDGAEGGEELGCNQRPGAPFKCSQPNKRQRNVPLSRRESRRTDARGCQRLDEKRRDLASRAPRSLDMWVCRA